MCAKSVLGLCVIFVINVSCQRNEDFLPKNVRPLRYTLTFEIINCTHYLGSTLIEIEALENTNNVTLHATNLKINQSFIRVNDENDHTIQHNNVSFEKAKDFYIINLDQTLRENKMYNLTIKNFFGSLSNDKFGLFRAEYEDLNNNITHLFVTEFSPMNARKVFPCFDEIAIKAKFIINLIRPLEKITASNMPLLKTINLGNNRYQDVYQETPLISTYLVAFTISSYKYTDNNGRIRILAPEHYIKDGGVDYILKESPGILKAFEEYTAIPYTLPKLDLVSVPHKNFVDGAMENWGLIAYSDTYIHCPHTYSINQLQTCLLYTVHEFAHQWFGNLATPKKWNYLWLSEGFASYFQYYMADKIKPSWRLKEQFVVEVIYTSMKNDYTEEPMNFIFTKKNDYPSPLVCYQKASSIIRMMSYVLTEEVFQEGLKTYLKNYAFKATEPLDLFDACQKALNHAGKKEVLGNLTIHEIMETWTNNVGFPIVTATRNYKTGAVTFSQKSSVDLEDDARVLWHIPITYVFSGGKNFDFNKTTADFWLSQINGTVNCNSSEGWYLVNKQAVGYYYVNYDETNWKRLIEVLHSKNYIKIPPVNRAQLINDAFYFVSQESLNPELLFNLTMYLSHETDYIPIYSFLKNVVDISGNLKKFEDKKLFKMYLIKILNASYTKLGITNKNTDTHVDRLHRREILPLVCDIDEQCQMFALKHLRNWRSSGLSLSGEDFDKSLLCGAIKLGTLEDWDFILTNYFLTKEHNLKKAYLHSLSCTKNQLIINKFLDEIFNINNTMSPEERSTTISEISSYSGVGKTLVLEYLMKMKDDKQYKGAFSEDSRIYLELTVNEAKKFVPAIRQRVKNIPIAFLNGEDFDSDIAEHFSNWRLKYFSVGNITNEL